MSFTGKKFKKTTFENVEELLDVFKAPDNIRALMKNTDSLSRYEKNDDGSLQYIVTKDGLEKLNMKVIPNKESDFTTPDGIKTKVISKISDDKVETLMTFPDGSNLHMDRVFEGNTMKLIIWKEGLDLKGIITYEEV